MRLFLGLSVPVLTPVALSGQACVAPTAEYTVRSAGADLFEVEASFALPTNRLDLRFSGAEGRPEAQAASVSMLRGWGATGTEVPIEYVGQGGWSSGKTPLSRISYRLAADHDQVRWTGGGMDEVASHFDDTYFFVGNAFFLIDYNWPSCPIDVAFDLPEDWSVLSPWSSTENGYRASEPATLEKNAFAVGHFETGKASAGVMSLEWVIDSRLKSIETPMAELMTKIPVVFDEFFGATPADRYAVVVFQGPYMDGGAFRQSFSLQLSTPLRETDALAWSHGLAHEMLHLWIGNHIRGEEPADTYWFTEGFTDYLAVKLMYRAGMLSESMLRQRLANLVRRYNLSQMMSPGTDIVSAGQEKNNNWSLIYGGGALIALMVDAENPEGFQAAMRDLSEGAAEPYSQRRLMERLDRSTAGAASRAFNAINGGLDPMSLATALGERGIEVTMFGPDEVYVGFAGSCDDAACVPRFLRR